MKILAACFFLFLFFPVYAQEKVQDYLQKKGSTGKNTWAIIIANEDYQAYADGYTENEELAIYQAERFQQMLIKQAGIPKENILFYANATNTHIKLAIVKLQKILTPGSKIILYFRGRTFRSSPDGNLFLVPIDSDGKEPFFMFGLEDIKKRLGNLNISSVDIFIDALPERTSSTLCILDNGFERLSENPSTYKNLVTFRVLSPLKKKDSVELPANTLAEKPQITILSPVSKVSTTYESTVFISGNIKSSCPIIVVAVKGEEASFNKDGAFTARVVLEEGENSILIEAKNCAGWSRENITLTRLSIPVDSIKTKSVNDLLQTAETEIQPSGKNYALLIGISKYKDAIMPDLFYPLRDAAKIKDVLISHYAFDRENVILLKNPERASIIGTLDSLKRVLKPEDSFLMFYAGHGSWDEKSHMGYWLPADAAAKVLDNWIMNSIITGFMSEIEAKHILVIADACFGGSIFRTRAFIPAEEKSIEDLYGKSSRKAMTSGDLTEVPDESIFVKYFLQKLAENTENYISSEKLFFEVKPKVADVIDLIPQFGIIKNSGDQGGDYIFFKKKEESLKFR